LTITVEIGYVGSMLELLQFMYLKNTGLLTNREKILELCAVLKMKPEFVIASNFVNSTHSIDLDLCQLSTEFVNLVSMKKYVAPVVNSQSTSSSSQFDIKVSSNEVTVNVQINNNNAKTNNDQMDNMVPRIAQFDQKPIDISNCDESLNHSKKTNTFLFIPPRILRSNMKRLRSTRNY
jgi:hypothetical protein